LQRNWSDSSLSKANEGYTASNTLSVRVRDLPSLGALLDAAVSDGANTLNGVNFAVTDPAPLLDEARKRAVADARHRAEVFAQAAGSTLGPITTITEGAGQSPAPQFGYARAAMAAPPVEAGEISLSAAVTITWQLAQ
jgi:hypothetical protein